MVGRRVGVGVGACVGKGVDSEQPATAVGNEPVFLLRVGLGVSIVKSEKKYIFSSK